MFSKICSLHASQAAFRAALCDSFNTPEAVNILRDLVSRTNVYLKAPGSNVEIGLVQRVARWVGDMLRMFGLGEGESTEIGWGQERSADEGGVNVRAWFLREESSWLTRSCCVSPA